MGKFSLANSRDLQGAKVVIVPDRDEPGIKDSDKAAQYFPEAMWLYPFPESKAWENLPKSDGLDIFDWIDQEKLAPSDIRAAIGEKKVFKALAPTPTPQAAANVIRPPQFQIPPIPELEGEIEELLDSDLKKSQLQLKISELAQKFRIPSADIWKIYREQEAEQEQEVNREDTAAEVARLLEIKQSKIKLSEILPTKLAEPIERLAKLLNLKPECYLAALLTQVSALFKVGTEIRLRRDTDYVCTPNYFAGIVAESSQKKSPIMKAMLTRPMKALQDKAREEFKEAFQAYEEEYATWKASKGEDKGPAPKEPRLRLYSLNKTTGEGILYQVQEFPDQALMYKCDELAGLFKSANQYRGGKGSDEEDLLEFWNGTGSTVLRAKGTTADLDGLLLSIFGTIQPDVLAGFLKDCSDSNGKFARFDFVVQPLAASDLPDEDTELPDTTTHILASLYKKVDALPKLEMEFDRDAKKLFATFYRAIEKQRMVEPKQGTRAMLGKMPEKVGKMSAIIHTINCVASGVEVDLLIPKTAVEAAIKFVKFTSDQIISLYTEFSDRTALAPNLMKILQAAEQQGGKITVREAQDILRVKQQRPTAQTVREWFSELQEMKHGEVTTVKKSTFFTLATAALAAISQNLEPERVKVSHNDPKLCATDAAVNGTTVAHCGTTAAPSMPQLESLPSKVLDTIAASAAHISPPSEKSENLLLSYLTEPEEFAEQIRKAIANFDRSLALQVWDALKAKLKRELRAEVKNHLTLTENENFKLLVAAGFLRGTRVKYVGDPKFAEQYEGLELEIYSIDEHSLITCRKPDGYLTSWMKPEELEKL
jgi:Ca2+-binding EF-hand superfamily protein